MALQQIANTDISSTGTFALGSVSSSALTSGRVTFATAGGLLTDSSTLTYDGTTLTSTKFAGALNGTVGATTPSTVVATSVTNSGLTSGRVTYASTGGLLVDSANLTFSGTSVGIGTASPAAKLDLGGNTASTVQQIFGRGVTDPDFTVRYTNGAAGTSAFIGTLGLDYGNGAFADMATIKFYRNSVAGELAFFASASGVSGTEKLRITSTTLHTANGVSVGIGTDSPYGLLNIKGSNGQLVLANGNTSGGMKLTASNSIYTGNGYLAFEGYANEYGRFDSSGNFGIGATSLAANFHISKSTTATVMISNISTSLVTDDAMGLIDFSAGSSNTVNARISGLVVGTSEAGGSLAVETRTDGGSLTEKFRITGAGNVGIGTPSPNAKLQVTTSSFPVLKVADELGGGAIALGDAAISSNYVGIWRGAVNSISGGGFLNVQGNGIAFMSTDNVFGSATRTMTLDNGGKLLVGTTNSQDAFVNGSTQAVFRAIFSKDNSSTAFDSVISQLAIDNINTTTNNYSQLAFTTSDGANRVVTAGIYAQITARSSANWTTSNLQFYTGTVGGPPTEKMRIDSSGNLLVGQTSSIYSEANRGVIELNGGTNTLLAFNIASSATNGSYFLNSSTSLTTVVRDARFYAVSVNGSERMRIDANGFAYIRATSQISSPPHQLTISHDNNNNYGLAIYGTAAGSTQQISFFNSAGTQQGYISTNGTGTTTYSTSSDYRLKENIVPMTGALAKIAQLKPVTYKWKEDGSDGQGFIAHELAEVVPQCVDGEKDGIHKDGKPKYQGVDTSFLVATLTAAIKEQQALIESMAAKLKDAGVAGF
jgi:hypothetical protein